MQTKTKKNHTVRGLVRRLNEAYERRPVRVTVALAAVLTLALEVLSRHSLVDAAAFILVHPVNFLANVSIVLLTLSISQLFKKRSFFLVLFAGLWLLLGLANAVVQFFRATPLGAVDLAILPSAISVVGFYVDTWLIIMLAVALLAGIGGIVMAYFRSEKHRPDLKRASVFVLASAVVMAGLYGATLLGSKEERAEAYANLMDAYDNYGFAYCFWTGALDRGIDEPEVYSEQAVDRLMDRLEPGSVPEQKPDVIMVQLESFFDVGYLDDMSLDEDPIPVFHGLKENFSTGFLTVPSVGAGTANTEFEVLSGMSLDFFGMGEYPYMTILQEEACETVARDLKAMGYATHAVHNYAGNFYTRNSVFAQLGFDSFTSLEYMNGVEYNPIGWAKDEVLTGEICKALDSSDDPQFVFAITVQCHGKYQRGEGSAEAEDMSVAWENDQEEENALAYYLSQLRETDAFIGALVDALEQRDKPAVLVLYGDHLPNFSIGSEQLANGDIFQTEYVIWDNMGLERSDGDLYAYQLSASVLERLGMAGGVITRYHQQMAGRQDYEEGLQLLEYDMLYGDFYCYGGSNPYTATALQMGIDPVRVDHAAWADGVLTAEGENFTDWSRLTVDGGELDTVLAADGTISAQLDEPPEPDAAITVRQRSVDKTTVLSETEAYIWEG